MEKLWVLKDKIVSGKKLIQIDGVVYRVQEERGEQVYVKREPDDASTTNSPAEKLLSVPALCFGYLKYIVAKATTTEGDVASLDDSVEARQAMTDLFLEGRKIRHSHSEWRAKLKKARSEVLINRSLLNRYRTESRDMVPRAELERTQQEIESWSDKLIEAETVLVMVKERIPTVFVNAEEVIVFFTEKFGFEIGYSTLLKYSKYGVPFGTASKGQRPCAVSEMAERDMLKVIRFAADRQNPFTNQEITNMATKIRDVEWQSRRDAATRPAPAPLAVSWVKAFRKRMRRNGVPSAEQAASNGHATSSIHMDDIGDSGAPEIVSNLRTAIMELARKNGERQEGVNSVREERALEEMDEMNEEVQVARDNIAELEHQMAEAKAVLEGLQKKAKRKAKSAKQTLLLPKRSLESERTVLDRVYAELQHTPSEVVCNRVGAQIDALQRAARDEFGAVVKSLSGPFVAARPTLESTNESTIQILSEAIEQTVSQPPTSPRKRRKKSEPI